MWKHLLFLGTFFNTLTPSLYFSRHVGLHVPQKSSQDCAVDIFLLLPDVPCHWGVFLSLWQSQFAAGLESVEEGRKTKWKYPTWKWPETLRTIQQIFYDLMFGRHSKWSEEQGGNQMTTFVKHVIKNVINLIPLLFSPGSICLNG